MSEQRPITLSRPFTIGGEPEPTGTLGAQMREHMRRLLEGTVRPKSDKLTIAGLQSQIDRTFEVFKAKREQVSFAEGAIFSGAMLFANPRDPTVLIVGWRSEFEYHPLHKAFELPQDAQPLGHFRGCDLYAWFGGLDGSAVVLACWGPSPYEIEESYHPEVLNGNGYTQAALAEGWRRAELLAGGPQP